MDSIRVRIRMRQACVGFALLVVMCGGYAWGQELSQEILESFHYRAIGPTRQGGRITDIAVPDWEKQPFTFYVACTGGLWKTDNYGNSFQSVFDGQNSICIGDVEVSWSQPDTIWAGTGEANFVDLYGDGVYKSVDGGSTWQHMGLKESRYIGRILIHPLNPEVVYVAALGYGFSDNPERGVFKTEDGGKTWSKSLVAKNKAGKFVGAVDLVMDPKTSDTLYAALWDRQGGQGSGIYKTTDAGRTWIRLSQGLPSGEIGRIGIDVYHRDPKVLYATVSESGRNIGIYRTQDGGLTWTKRGKAISGGSFFGQIRVDPNDPEVVYNFQAQMDKSIDGGKTWGRAWRWGGDHHALWINPNNSLNILSGYDYGFAMTHDGGENWYHADELPLAQFYAIGVDMDYPYNVYGGMQDFGTWKGPNTNKGYIPIRFEDWSQVGTADGFYCQVDPTDSRWLYIETQNGGFLRFDQQEGTKKRLRYRGNSKVRFNFNSPILISPHNSKTLYHGANMLLRSKYRGENWEEISPDLSKPAKSQEERTRRERGTITTIAESPVRQGVLWAGTDDGNLWISREAGENWALLNEFIPNNHEYLVSRIIASHHFAGTAYVSYNGLRHDDLASYIFRTTDYGKTWTSIAGNLPSEPINVVREDHHNPDLLFVGTDRSVYATIDCGKNWARMKNNMPAIPVHDLVIHPRENDLVVGTHGRGFYITDISPLQELTSDVLDQEVYFFHIEPRVQWKIISQHTRSAQNFSGENETRGIAVNYYLKERFAGEVNVAVYQGQKLLQQIPASNEPGLNQVVWPFTWKRERTLEEKKRYKRNRGIPSDSEGEWGQEYFDYYDQLEWFGDEDTEVGINGQSLMTRRHINDWETDPDFKYTRVRPGTFTVVLTVGDRTWKRRALVLKDHWVKDQQ